MVGCRVANFATGSRRFVWVYLRRQCSTKFCVHLRTCCYPMSIRKEVQEKPWDRYRTRFAYIFLFVSILGLSLQPVIAWNSLLSNKSSSDAIPSASPITASPTTLGSILSPTKVVSPATKSMPPPTKKASVTPTRRTRSQNKLLPIPATIAPEAAVAPEAGEILSSEHAELHLFDVGSGTFTLQDREVVVTVSEVGQWQCMFLSSHLSRAICWLFMYRLVADWRWGEDLARTACDCWYKPCFQFWVSLFYF